MVLTGKKERLRQRNNLQKYQWARGKSAMSIDVRSCYLLNKEDLGVKSLPEGEISARTLQS